MKKELNKYLKELDKKALEDEIKKLYSKFDLVKKYYQMELSQDTTAILEQFKKRIKNEYLPARGFGRASSRESKKVITEFKKISIFKEDLINLLMYRVRVMLDYTMAYGDIDEPFYNSMCGSFHDACELIAQEKLQKEFREELKEFINQSENFGWGVTNDFMYSFEHHIGDFYE